jgi:hypothetical protein
MNQQINTNHKNNENNNNNSTGKFIFGNSKIDNNNNFIESVTKRSFFDLPQTVFQSKETFLKTNLGDVTKTVTVSDIFSNPIIKSNANKKKKENVFTFEDVCATCAQDCLLSMENIRINCFNSHRGVKFVSSESFCQEEEKTSIVVNEIKIEKNARRDSDRQKAFVHLPKGVYFLSVGTSKSRFFIPSTKNYFGPINCLKFIAILVVHPCCKSNLLRCYNKSRFFYSVYYAHFFILLLALLINK